MGGKLTIYHGSQKLIQQPVYGAGNVRNDYGLGFYCTENVDLAKEWACTEENSGYANCYQLDLGGLTILDLSDHRYHILNWLSLLLQNRVFKISNDLAAEGKEYMLDTFLPEYEDKDIIIGYRADDSYFAFANAFLNNTLSLAQLEKAMYLGKLPSYFSGSYLCGKRDLLSEEDEPRSGRKGSVSFRTEQKESYRCDLSD